MSIDLIRTKDKVGMHDLGVELDFSKSKIITIIGQNGSGKSMFLKGLSKEVAACNNSGGDSSVLTINKSMNQYDLNQLELFILDEKIFDKKSRSALIDVFSNFKQQNKFTKEELLDSISQYYYSKIKSITNEWENAKPIAYSELILPIINTSNNYYELVEKLSEAIKSNNDYQEEWKQVKPYTEQFRRINNELSKSLEKIKCYYISAIHSTTEMVLNKNLDLNYLNDKFTISAKSFFDFKILYNLIINSSIKDSFRFMDVNDIVKLTNDIEFQNSISNWLSAILSQPIQTKIIFNKIEPSNANENIELNVAIEFYDRVTNEKINFNELSTGTKVLLNILNNISNLDNQTLVIVDEPETGMHPVMQTHVKNWFYEVSEATDARFILCTHSLFFLPEDIENENVYISFRSTSNKKHWTLTEANEFMEEKNCEDELQLFSYIKYIPDYEINECTKTGINVIVEGKSDEILLTHLARIFGYKVPEDIKFLKTPIFNSGYKGVYPTYINLKKKYPDLKIVATTDNDLGTPSVDPNKEWLKRLETLGENYIKIGKEGKAIESLFEHSDALKYCKVKEKETKAKKAKNLLQLKNANQLHKNTYNNFNKLFQELGLYRK